MRDETKTKKYREILGSLLQASIRQIPQEVSTDYRGHPSLVSFQVVYRSNNLYYNTMENKVRVVCVAQVG